MKGIRTVEMKCHILFQERSHIFSKGEISLIVRIHWLLKHFLFLNTKSTSSKFETKLATEESHKKFIDDFKKNSPEPMGQYQSNRFETLPKGDTFLLK